jgi:3-oxoacyl-[acyl-carrier protein] reductase
MRSKRRLNHIRAETDIDVIPIAADDERGSRARAGGLPDPGYSRQQCGSPPPGDFRDVTREDWIRAVNANMLTPIFFDPLGV